MPGQPGLVDVEQGELLAELELLLASPHAGLLVDYLLVEVVAGEYPLLAIRYNTKQVLHLLVHAAGSELEDVLRERIFDVDLGVVRFGGSAL